MDSKTASFIALIYGILGVTIIGLLIFLIIRRIRLKKNETFEKRDN